MLKHQRVKGAYFLFTLGFLLVFSSGFFAFLAWDGPGFQGSVAALEQPVTPPSLDSKVGKSGVTKVHASAKPAATLESPESQPPAAVPGKPVAPLAPPPTGEVKPAASQQQPPSELQVMEAKTVLPETGVSKNKGDQAASSSGHGVQSEKSKGAVKEAKASSAKPKMKTRKVRRTPPPVVDETQVPPEWNWFATPLRVAMKDHKVEIVSDAPLASSDVPQSVVLPAEKAKSESEEPSKDREIVQKSDVATEPAKDTEAVSSVVPFTTLEESEAYAERLSNILARLQERREKRAAEASAHSLVLPSTRGTSKSAETIRNDSRGAPESPESLEPIDTPAEAAAAATEGLPPLPLDYPSGDTGR